jgi:hypothetical protein
VRSKGSPDTGLPTIADTNQTRTTPLFLKSSDFATLGDKENPFISEELAENPAVSDKQQRFMAMCSHDPGKAQGKCPSKSVAKEFDHK